MGGVQGEGTEPGVRIQESGGVAGQAVGNSRKKGAKNAKKEPGTDGKTRRSR
jgi:hypothetical protein